MRSSVIHFSCIDQEGIVSRITSIIYNFGANIIDLEQFVDKGKKIFFMRIHLNVSYKSANHSNLFDRLEKESLSLNGCISIFDLQRLENVALLCTKEIEPVYDILIKHSSNEIKCNIPVIISNHSYLENIASQFNIKYIKINPKDEKNLLNILIDYEVDLIVLARYMQIIGPNIVSRFQNRIINIHHGFLPAFKGSNPYRQAWNKGVKMVGATSHYVTNKLDEGPIIAQDVVSTGNKESVNEMQVLGREVERKVLSSAVKAHLQRRVVVSDNKTIIFNE